MVTFRSITVAVDKERVFREAPGRSSAFGVRFYPPAPVLGRAVDNETQLLCWRLDLGGDRAGLLARSQEGGGELDAVLGVDG